MQDRTRIEWTENKLEYIIDNYTVKSLDEMTRESGLSADRIRAAVYQMRQWGIPIERKIAKSSGLRDAVRRVAEKRGYNIKTLNVLNAEKKLKG
jgi:hypothetical protein